MSDERNEMTPQFMDELASAYLDGEATPEEIALVEGDPRLRALVEEHRAVKGLIATPVEAPTQEVQNEMIARALSQEAPVVPLESARRRRAVGPRTRVILAAAAVVAALAVAGVALFDRATQDDGEMVANDSAPAASADTSAMEADSADESPADDAAPESAQSQPAEGPTEESMRQEDKGEPTSDPESEELTGGDDLTNGDMPQDGTAEGDMPQGTEPGDDIDPNPVQTADDSGTAASEFDTQDDLVNHIIQMLREPQDDMDEAQPDDSVFCAHPFSDDLELLAQFAATVAGTEVEVTVYRDADGLNVLQTTFHPDCNYISPLAIDWGK